MDRKQAEKIALAAMPGWVVVQKDAARAWGTPLTFLDPSKNFDELKARYFGEQAASSGASENQLKDLHFISMKLKEPADRNMVKQVLVRDDKVVGVQG